MARQKNTTAKRGRPPKNAVKKRGPGRPRKVRDTLNAFDAPSAVDQAQQDRQHALYAALQAAHGPISPGALVAASEIIRTYLVNGVSEPKAVEPAPIPETGPIGSGGMTLEPRGIAGPYEGNTARTHQLGEAAE